MTTKKLWQKNNLVINPIIEKYTVGDDYILDNELLPYDITASLTHAKGLNKINILSNSELQKIVKELNKLKKLWQQRKVKVSLANEDCHTLIENYLTLKLGKVGKKIHTGRSRNDQVLVALRLYKKDQAGIIAKLLYNLASNFLKLAKKYKLVPLPGYSHTQQAMLSSVGHYYSAVAAGLIDDLELLGLVSRFINVSPLGSAAGFGVALPLKREFVAKELGFNGAQINSLYCQNSRGKYESLYLECLTQIMQTLSKWATDMLFFTSFECQYFDVAPGLATGSSIMPHKKNLDVLELVRANSSVVVSNQLLIKELNKNLLSGYNRDFQLMKKPLFESVKIVKDSLAVAFVCLSGFKPNAQNIAKKINKGIFMADYANNLVKEKGLPFREAYLAATKLNSMPVNLVRNIKSKVSLGAPGNLQLNKYWQKLKKVYNLF